MSLEFAEKAIVAAESLLKETSLLEQVAPVAERLLGAAGPRAVEAVSEFLVGPRNAGSALEATEFIRNAPVGASKAFFLKASDGAGYWTKGLGNPQGDVILGKQYIAGNVCDYMRLSAPKTAIINIPEDFIQANRSVLPQGIRPGPAIGSLDLGPTAVPSLSKESIGQVRNLHHFGTDMVTNISVSNYDGPQVLFTTAEGGGHIAHFTDWGMSFQPYEIFFEPSRSMSGYYGSLTREAVESDIGRMMNMPRYVLTDPFDAMPAAWKADGLDGIISKGINSAMKRIQNLPQLVRQSIDRSVEWFPRIGEGPFRKYY
jgi:hypothetical protein